MPDQNNLSEQGKLRRDAIRAHILDQTPTLARNRKQKRQSLQALTITTLAFIIALQFVMRTASNPSNTTIVADPATPHTPASFVQVTIVSTDPSIIERFRFEAQSNPTTQPITDEQLLTTLESLGIQTGMIKTDTQTILTADIFAAQIPLSHTTDS